MVLRLTSVLLTAGLILPAAVPAHAQAEAFAISVGAEGPIAPGERVTVSLSGGTPGGQAIVRQCNADATACGSTAFLSLDGTGAGEAEIIIRRRVAGANGVVDCADSSCELTARLFDGSEASTPISVDGSVPIVRPVLSVDPTTPLPDRASVQLRGSGFEPGTSIQLYECAWGKPSRCLTDASGFAFTSGSGAFSTTVPVTRLVNEIDCAQRRGRCHIWAFPDGDIDHVAVVALEFDPTEPPIVPDVSVDPADGLRHGQTVTIAGGRFFANAFAQIEQCATPGTPAEHCRHLGDAVVDAAGEFTTDVAIVRRVGLDDCAVVACIVRVRVYPTDRIDVAISFDGSVPPPPIPSVTVEPDSGLVDRQVVDIAIRDAEPGAFAQLQLCNADHTTCRGNAGQLIEGTSATIRMALPRVLGPDIDCARVPCVLVASFFGRDSYSFDVPVGFDPDAPLAESASIRIVPDAGLWDRQNVEVRGERFDPGAFFSVRQCVGTNGDTSTCVDGGGFLAADNEGNLSGRLSVRRTLHLPGGAQDCAAVACFLVVDSDPPAALALEFDPDGPLRGADLPAQQPCVAWPTQGWPTGPLPAGVDPAAVQAVGETMVGPGAADSVVVIHGGRLVYERYSPGITADTILPSFSMSKSFTSTIIGLLVDDERLALDERVPIPEWSAPEDPRNAITLRNVLNMSSGLEWNESYTDPRSDVFQMIGSSDAAAYVIAKPLAVTPGTQFHYSTGDTTVLSRIIGDTAGVSGATYNKYLHEQLLDPLGINPVEPGFDAAGRWAAGWKTDTTTRNFAKLGLLYLRNGVWEDEQFVSPDWVDFVRTPGAGWSGYGGQFWLDPDGSFRMVGFLGQTVHIIPELDLIVAVNNGGSDFDMVELFRNAQPVTCGEAQPAVVDDTATVSALGSVGIDVLANDTQGAVGLAPATLTIAKPPVQGSAEVVDGAIRYTSDPGFTGTDSASYVVCTNDRRRCLEAAIKINVEPLPFEFLPPVRDGLNRRWPGLGVLVPFRMPAGKTAVERIASVPVDCATGEAIGNREPVRTQLHVFGRRGTGWFWWSTTPTWTGCRDFEVTLRDGEVHTAHFSWRDPVRR